MTLYNEEDYKSLIERLIDIFDVEVKVIPSMIPDCDFYLKIKADQIPFHHLEIYKGRILNIGYNFTDLIFHQPDIRFLEKEGSRRKVVFEVEKPKITIYIKRND